MGEPLNSPYGQKRPIDQMGFNEHQKQIKLKRSLPSDISNDSDMNDSIDNLTSDDIFLPAMQPQVTINESPRYDSNLVKRETTEVSSHSPTNVWSSRNPYRKIYLRNYFPPT